MKKCRITALRRTEYPDLMEQYENPLDWAGLGNKRLGEASRFLRKCMEYTVPVCDGVGTWR